MLDITKILQKRLQEQLGPRGGVAEFCRKTGFARTGVQNWLDGKSSPTVENLGKIAEGLGIEPWELIKPEEPAQKPVDMMHELFSILAAADQSQMADCLDIIRAHVTGETPSGLPRLPHKKTQSS